MRPTLLTLVGALALGLAACSADVGVSRTLGARCDRLDDCDERCLVDAEDYPGGLCSVSCMNASDCPDGAVCVDRDGGICLFECADDADCAFLDVGWRCKTADALPGGEVMACLGE